MNTARYHTHLTRMEPDTHNAARGNTARSNTLNSTESRRLDRRRPIATAEQPELKRNGYLIRVMDKLDMEYKGIQLNSLIINSTNVEI
ncbi:hypothetical protein EVAR_47236_1 [Eumeta japonica]|uniref:Uncharacterized protein n=1 Tax=Eumeta variegata TaxID=151549 RepID=A0A4C1XP82_EUMVA|nr:hypothetical protein EVAR_47236_1 [Eumeta japonica]